MALELPFSVKLVNPLPVDFWSGPYVGAVLQEAIDTANSGIPSGVRFKAMEVQLVVNGSSLKYWYNSGTDDSSLIPFTASSSGNFFTNVTADDGTVSATTPGDTIRIVNASKTGPKEITTTGGGGGTRTFDNISSDFSMGSSSDVVFADSTSSPINVYIPTAVGVGGKEIAIKWAAGNNSILINASGAESVDGQSTFMLDNPYQSIALISNNSNWLII